jgi:hypothetical protein
VTTIGLSTAVLAAPGIASAGPTALSFTATTPTTVTVPPGTCAIDWVLFGGRGGADSNGVAADAPLGRTARTLVTAGEEFTLAPGGAGGNASTDPAGGTNPAGNGDWDGDAGNSEGLGGGGGGAASAVLQGTAVHLDVNGGPGAGADGGQGGVVSAVDNAVVLGEAYDTPALQDVAPGLITGVGIACGTEYFQAPAAPDWVGVTGGLPGQLSVSFTPRASSSPAAAPATGWEYSLDGGGSWMTADTTTPYPDMPTRQEFTVTGLADRQTYYVRVRATSAAGAGAASAPVLGQTYTRSGNPTALTVQTRPSALLISWSAPTSSALPIDGYDVSVFPEDFGMDSDWQGAGCRTDATTFSCVVAVPAGARYDAHINSVAGDAISEWVSARSDVVPALELPVTVPEKDGDLLGETGLITSVTAGEPVTIKGSGFAPNSTVRAIAYSTPTELKTFVTDENGEFEVTVEIPAELPAGQHSLVVTGVGADGEVRNLRVDVTVFAAGATPVITGAELTGSETVAGTAAGTAAPDGERLAFTGASVVGPAVGGLAALLVGAGLLVSSRRRSTQRTD